jgi:hypothetical protein
MRDPTIIGSWGMCDVAADARHELWWGDTPSSLPRLT